MALPKPRELEGMKPKSPSSSQRPVRGQTAAMKFIVGAIVVALLYFGKPVLLPVALGIYFSLILTPLVLFLQRRRIPRAAAVVIVIVTVAITLSTGILLLSSQMLSLMEALPAHTENVKTKVRSIRGLGESSVFERLDYMWTEVQSEWTDGQSPPAQTEPALTGPGTPQAGEQTEEEVVPVKVQSGTPAWQRTLPVVAKQVGGTALLVGLGLVVAFFIMLRQERIRNRIIRLVGGKPVVTTKAVDEAGERIARFLRAQLILNTGYGAAWGVGLYFIGLDYAALWGFLAAILRFVPYVGPWISAILPLILATAQFEGWWQLVLILGLIAALELVTNNFLEPVLYGRSTGVSEIAMFISAIFWTFVWGPIGLLLSGPATVCLAVVGNRFPQLKVLDLLLSENKVLEPHESFYHRLIARDFDEAYRIACAELKRAELLGFFDDVLIPALNLLKHDRASGDVNEADEKYVISKTRDVMECLTARFHPHPRTHVEVQPARRTTVPPVRALGFPARDAADVLALEMLRAVLDPKEWDFDVASEEQLTGERLGNVAEQQPAVVCVAALPPDSVDHERYVCKRLQREFPEIQILIGRWGIQDGDDSKHALPDGTTDETATTLRETRDQLNIWLPVLRENGSPEAQT